MRKDMVCLSVIVLIAASIAFSMAVAGYFWIPSWHGWLPLIIGIVLTSPVAFVAYNVCVFVSRRSFGMCSLFFRAFVVGVLLTVDGARDKDHFYQQ